MTASSQVAYKTRCIPVLSVGQKSVLEVGSPLARVAKA